MLKSIIYYSIRNKTIVLLFIAALIGIGVYSLFNIPIGAVPDVTNNQVQVITTSRDLSTQDVERYLTYPVELEMANLPGVEEIRSISKFGLSVVTIVFSDEMGTYLPRQLISERLKAVEDQIPNGFGTPTMGPISTGLGEIYQYILDIKPQYVGHYSVTELRTIQDWIVKRQLSGIPGVVEVNTWGGFLKTFEVGVDPRRLQSLDITLAQVYDALESNNSVAGGGYIEKTNEAFFIRSEGLLGNIEDIKNVVVTNRSGAPILIKDIAEVGLGSATRFGAITGNGEGEKILGQVMMLKGANSKKVIDNVIDQVTEVQSSLPEGVFINPFLERSELIGRTTFTIAENLILGFLIVLFVVVFLLGNIRSGLVVASVIPLTLLFALTAMYFFGVDANLMSLGAIDFGIIIDGAVIIVEFIAFSLTQNSDQFHALTKTERRSLSDKIVGQGASKMMHSAAFGQIIIIIVFIPVLALAGVEGKMFKPMALTFCFALIGAMILCFTYVPVMAALFLKPDDQQKSNISSKFIHGIKSIYKPVLTAALKTKKLVLAIAIALFTLTIILFSKMGGEFVPTLDEGDFVIQPVLKVGMSLAETVKMTTRIEKICLRFPEVKQVVSRIGAAEVPTDPMSMEESDVIITLKDKKEWTSAKTKDELADVIKDAILDEIPGIEIEFTQPIEMRFNELISGVSSDLAVKIFGEDLEALYDLANAVENEINQVSGVADISVEKIDGLPQMSITYDRAKIAKYGLNIDLLNDLISIGFAGKSTGVMFEGERQFDIMLRYDAQNRNDLNSIMTALVDLPNGQKLPLSEFAKIEYSSGPAMISRDDTKRRVVVGINVRNRDLQSVVDEVRQIVSQKVNIPVGYSVSYGGQFENLEKATQRLLVAVPIALVLIFVLLYFAFHSIKEALLIFSAIPLATIGGVLALYLRDLPFSISAGIGFIALFGIAVLNGIVMIEHFKELKSTDMDNPDDIITQGAIDRIRPVLLTAIAAALGFLPMAISSSAGAEVQRPLATVVIGGLVSATLLTLIVLPVLYRLFMTKSLRNVNTISKTIGIGLLLFTLPFSASAQQVITLDQAIEMGIANSLSIEASNLNTERERTLIDASKEISKTEIFYEYDRNNVPENGPALHVFGINQSFKWPGVNDAKIDLQKAKVVSTSSQTDLFKNNIAGAISQTYDKVQYLQSLLHTYKGIDSLYADVLQSTDIKLELGASTIIEKLLVSQKAEEIKFNLDKISAQYQDAFVQLKYLLRIDEPFTIPDIEYSKRIFQRNQTGDNPFVLYQNAMIAVAEKESITVDKAKLPDWNIGLFNGINSFADLKLYPGIQAGIAVTLNSKHYDAQSKAAQLDIEAQKIELEKIKQSSANFRDRLESYAKSIDQNILTFESSVQATASRLLEAAKSAYLKNEIDYFEYVNHLSNTSQVSIKRMNLLHEYNQTIIKIQYLIK